MWPALRAAPCAAGHACVRLRASRQCCVQRRTPSKGRMGTCLLASCRAVCTLCVCACVRAACRLCLRAACRLLAHVQRRQRLCCVGWPFVCWHAPWWSWCGVMGLRLLPCLRALHSRLRMHEAGSAPICATLPAFRRLWRRIPPGLVARWLVALVVWPDVEVGQLWARCCYCCCCCCICSACVHRGCAPAGVAQLRNPCVQCAPRRVCAVLTRSSQRRSSSQRAVVHPLSCACR